MKKNSHNSENNTPQTLIELKDIYKTYMIGTNKVHAVAGINMKIMKGELVSIMGASGSGKTSSMNILGLLDRPTSGSYFLEGHDVAKLHPNKLAHIRNRTIGFIFQQFYLLSRFTALQNTFLPLVYRSEVSRKQMIQLAMNSLEAVGMAAYANHRPTELSGGQQQRVAIARALIGSPSLILADEPTGSLDSKTGQDVMNLLIDINKQRKATVVVVTHDIRVAEQCERIIRISDGKIVV